jgi:hypothetical protein
VQAKYDRLLSYIKLMMRPTVLLLLIIYLMAFFCFACGPKEFPSSRSLRSHTARCPGAIQSSENTVKAFSGTNEAKERPKNIQKSAKTPRREQEDAVKSKRAELRESLNEVSSLNINIIN